MTYNEKEAVKAETEEEFSPFKVNQMRWALHCIKWEKDIGWSKFPQHIMGTLKEKGRVPTLGEKALRTFVLDGHVPWRMRLRMFEQYIREVAPEYAETFEELDAHKKLADFISIFYRQDEDYFQNIPLLNKLAFFLEQYVYVSFGGLDPANRLLQSNFEKPFGELHTCMAFRKIGNTPNLWVHIFCIDDDFFNKEHVFSQIRQIKEKHLPPEGTFKTRSRIFSALEELRIEDIKGLHSGIVCPDPMGENLIGIIKGPHNIPSPFVLRIAPFLRAEDSTLDRRMKQARTKEEEYYLSLKEKDFYDLFKMMTTPKRDQCWDYFFLKAHGVTFPEKFDECFMISPDFKKLKEEIGEEPRSAGHFFSAYMDWKNYNLPMFGFSSPYLQKIITLLGPPEL